MANKKVALIIRIARQNGSYLAEFLLEKTCEFYGVKQRIANFSPQCINHLSITKSILN